MELEDGKYTDFEEFSLHLIQNNHKAVMSILGENLKALKAIKMNPEINVENSVDVSHIERMVEAIISTQKNNEDGIPKAIMAFTKVLDKRLESLKAPEQVKQPTGYTMKVNRNKFSREIEIVHIKTEY